MNAQSSDEARQRDLALEALERLPRIPAPASLARNVMAAVGVKTKRENTLSRLRLWLERHPLLGWELSGAALAASVLFITLAPLSQTSQPGRSAPASSPFTQASYTSGPSSNALRFSLYSPQAHSVALIGDFNGWGSMAQVKLTPCGNGMWSVTVPLPAGRYQYAFLVNGKRWVTDPRAEQHVNHDFGSQNAVVTIIEDTIP